MKQLKNYMKMINPFNNEQEMPITIYILKKFLAFIVIYLISGVAGEAIIIGGLSTVAGNYAFSEYNGINSVLYVCYIYSSGDTLL